ncbi:allatostatin [Cydia pomonella]|uniref:Allatostatin c n=1 Tax=Cydia pomonella TaxID=82600 RepID=A0A514YLJ7_CYDPO|nr:allatostatin [Cydia pomonella]QDK59880.1 allatostatin c [Cydia pomonella]
MKCPSAYSSMFVLVSTLAFLLVSANAAPIEPDDEQSENTLVAHDSNDMDMSGVPWDAVNAAALRKLLLQLDAEERLGMGRVGRSWPQAEPRGWSRTLDGRLVRPWRADKRQVRFRQCYFNPISCFRK